MPPSRSPRPARFGAFRLTGILVAGLIALAAGISTFAQHGSSGEGVRASTGGIRALANPSCRRAVREASRLPPRQSRRESIAQAAGMARLLRWTASDLRAAGADEPAWAFQTWAAANDDVTRALQSRDAGTARAVSAEWLARRDAAASARALGAERCVQLARRG